MVNGYADNKLSVLNFTSGSNLPNKSTFNVKLKITKFTNIHMF